MTVVLAFPAFAASGTFHLDQSSLGIKVGETALLVPSYDSFSVTSAMWITSDPSVATVDGNGNVTGVKLGQATITAQSPSGDIATCRVHVALKGIDVSRYQYSIDWNSVKNAGIDFAIIRTGFGGENWEKQTDPYFEANYAGATQNGIKVGVYHYSYATNTAMASQEADLCLSILKGRHLDYPVFYDVENSAQNALSPDTLAAIVNTFASKLQQAGYKVGLYSFVNFYNAHLTSSALDSYDKWVANTGVDAPNFSKPYTMWQYGQRPVSGISGNTDVDYCYTDYAGTASPVTPSTPTSDLPADCFVSDTNGTYTFGSNSTYTYKITTRDTFPPTAVSSNTSAITVQLSKQLSDGFLFKITNVGAGQATITTTAGDGRSVSFVAVGSSTQQIAPPAQSESGNSEQTGGTLISDTTAPYTFGANTDYYYKIITSEETAPTAVSSNPSAVPVSFSKKLTDGYLYKISNAGSGTAVITTTAASGAKASFTAYGTAKASSSDISVTAIVSDTPSQFTMKLGSTYQFRFTPGKTGTFIFTSGNGSILKNVSTTKIGKDYFYKVKAVGKGCVGIYGQEKGKGGPRLCVVNVA